MEENICSRFGYKYYSLNKGSKNLICFLNGAIDRNKKSPPIYQRLSWVDECDFSVLFLSDFLVDTSPDLELAWYLGRKNDKEIFNSFVANISKICQSYGVETSNIIFFGSSGGGFSALNFASIFLGSSAIAINPQTNTEKYIEHVFEKFSLVSGYEYGDPSNNILKLFEARNCIPQFIYYQNIQDGFHYRQHYNDMLSWYSSNSGNVNRLGAVQFIEYYDVRGHNGVFGKEKSLEIIDSYIASQNEGFVLLGNTYKDGIGIFPKIRRLDVQCSVNSLNSMLIVSIKSKKESYRGWRYSDTFGLYKYFTINSFIEDFSIWLPELEDDADVRLFSWRSNEKIKVIFKNLLLG